MKIKKWSGAQKGAFCCGGTEKPLKLLKIVKLSTRGEYFQYPHFKLQIFTLSIILCPHELRIEEKNPGFQIQYSQLGIFTFTNPIFTIRNIYLHKSNIHNLKIFLEKKLPLSKILLNRRKVDIFPYCKKSANIYLLKSNICHFK